MAKARCALVTGGNRGIGFEICRGLAKAGCKVILGARDRSGGQAAVQELQSSGGNVRFELIDVADPASVDACCKRLAAEPIHVDILVNNAGVYGGDRLLEATEEELSRGFATNLFGPLRLCQRLMPAMAEAGYGRVVNVSSGLGQVSGGLTGGAGVYNVSKAALNAITVRLAHEAGEGVKVNALCPGWVRTRMGGESAPRTPEEGADTAVWLATLDDDGPNGGFFRDRQPIEW